MQLYYTNCILRLLQSLFFSLLFIQSSYGVTIFVDINATTGTNNGTSWSNAFTDLQDAIDLATAVDEIWVAKGTYKPTSLPPGNVGDPREATFYINHLVKIYGGYESGSDIRNPIKNITILSGGIGAAGLSDNAYHVIKTEHTSFTIDGFTIKKGYADALVSVTDNYGSGLIIFNTGCFNCNATINNCIFSGNTAQGKGGAIYSTNTASLSQILITNSIFTANEAFEGGAIYNEGNTSADDALAVYNTVFTTNSASTNGGAIAGSSLNNGTLEDVIINCTFSNNTAAAKGASIHLNNNTSTAYIQNSILWNMPSNELWSSTGANININYSIINDGNTNGTISLPIGITGNNNSDRDPLFKDAANPAGPDGCYRTYDDGLILTSGSIAIDGANNGFWNSTGLVTDIIGTSRSLDPFVDMGAYEARQVKMKAFLQGAYNGGGMSTYLADQGLIPVAGCGGGAVLSPEVINATGDHRMVDWVKVKIISPAPAYTEIANFYAVLRANGEIVDVSGGPLVYSVPSGNYHLLINHRNHLGIMTANPVFLD